MPEGEPIGSEYAARVRRTYVAWRGQSSWLHKVVAFVVLMVLLGLAGALFVWGLVIGAVVVVIGAVVWAVRSVRAFVMSDDRLRRGVRIVRRE